MHQICITVVTVTKSVITWFEEISSPSKERLSLDVIFPERGERTQEWKYGISPLIFLWLKDIEHDYLFSHKVTSFN